MNEQRTKNPNMKPQRVYTKKAGKSVKYIVTLQQGSEYDPEDVEIRKTHARYGFVAVHRYQHEGMKEPKQAFTFHRRHDLAMKSGEFVTKVLKVEHLADEQELEELRPKAREAIDQVQDSGKLGISKPMQASVSVLSDFLLRDEAISPEAVEARIEVILEELGKNS
jgi:hypothetical protein